MRKPILPTFNLFYCSRAVLLLWSLEAIDPNLVSGAAFGQCGRTCAAKFSEMPAETTYTILQNDPPLVAMTASEHKAPLNINTALAGCRMQLADNPDPFL
jgi:hypothetical protein